MIDRLENRIQDNIYFSKKEPPKPKDGSLDAVSGGVPSGVTKPVQLPPRAMYEATVGSVLDTGLRCTSDAIRAVESGDKAAGAQLNVVI